MDVVQEHQSQIRELLIYWQRDLQQQIEGKSQPTFTICNAERDKLFPYLLQHCPSVNEKYQHFQICKNKYNMVFTLDSDDYLYITHEIDNILVGQDSGLPETIDWADFENPLLHSWEKLTSDAIDYLVYYEDNYYKYRKIQANNWLFNPLSFSTAEEDAEMREAILHFGDDLISFFKDNEILYSIREKLQAHKKTCRITDEALYDLYEAINICIISHEYMKNKCDWCPPE